MSSRGGFRGGSRGGFGGGFGGGRGGGRGGFNSSSMGPPDEVQPLGEFMHACEGEMICESTNTKIPYFNAPIYTESKSLLGKVDEILGPMNQVYFTVKPTDGIVATSFKAGDKVYIGSDKLLPLSRFLPQPKPTGGVKKSGGRGTFIVRKRARNRMLTVSYRWCTRWTWWCPWRSSRWIRRWPWWRIPWRIRWLLPRWRFLWRSRRISWWIRWLLPRWRWRLRWRFPWRFRWRSRWRSWTFLSGGWNGIDTERRWD
ncbi:hypothetical protein G7K_0803-t1 [Saitoella complicata NRRL Y-17804]|uniref:H/ACA ribonucleoprotein complex subunit n=1 Tax=Saitoella complicata (strain BCRC 22490 / CBS 7301 / JCM 7358 / NBRC 10748 / NRRL Y-17804) TaxID=698492 RepID=A0A0E9N9S2_SAICN|nr:hypothetical protein G7K_0803-t1 [Saitoella complicata NRRL Y-17804]